MVKVLVTGSPGVGKTTLLQHLATQLGPDQSRQRGTSPNKSVSNVKEKSRDGSMTRK